jgi:hypothetical protein
MFRISGRQLAVQERASRAAWDAGRIGEPITRRRRPGARWASWRPVQPEHKR